MFVINALTLGGAQTRVLELSRAFRSRGHQVALVYFMDGDLKPSFSALGVELMRIDSSFGRAGELYSLSRIVKSWRPQIMHSHLFLSTTLCRVMVLLRSLTGGAPPPLISTIHGVEKSRYWFLEQALHPLSARVITVSRYLSRLYHDSSARVRVIPGGVDLAASTQICKPLSGSEIVIGTLGRLDRVKGVDILLRAYAALDPQVRERTRILIGGPGREFKNLTQEAGNLGIQDRISFSGSIDDVDAFMNSIDLFVMPSRQEGQGLAMLEAMARGRVVLAARAGGMPEQLRHGRTGYLFGREDHSSLARTIEWVDRNRSQAREIASAAREWVFAWGGLERMVESVMEIYDEVQMRGSEVVNPANHKKPRLLLVISSDSMGGGQRNFLQIASHFRNMGWPVAAVIAGPGRLEKKLEELGIPRIIMPLEGRSGGAMALLPLAQLLRRGNYDLVHGHLNRGALISSLAARLAGVPCLTTVHGLNRRIYYRFAHRVLAVCEAARENLIAQGLNPEKVTCLRNGVEMTRQALNPEGSLAGKWEVDGHSKGPFPSNMPVLGMVARLHPNKGHETALRAIALLNDKGINCALQILGEGDSQYRERLEALTGELGITDRVHFSGHQDNPEEIMIRWSCLLIPSFQEALPYVALEAMVSGVPVIGSRVGGLPEILGERAAEFLVPAGEVAPLAEAIGRLLKMDTAARASLREQNFQRVRESFSLSGSMEALERVYREMLRGQR